MRYTYEQGLVKYRLKFEELFHPSTLNLEENIGWSSHNQSLHMDSKNAALFLEPVSLTLSASAPVMFIQNWKIGKLRMKNDKNIEQKLSTKEKLGLSTAYILIVAILIGSLSSSIFFQSLKHGIDSTIGIMLLFFFFVVLAVVLATLYKRMRYQHKNGGGISFFIGSANILPTATYRGKHGKLIAFSVVFLSITVLTGILFFPETMVAFVKSRFLFPAIFFIFFIGIVIFIIKNRNNFKWYAGFIDEAKFHPDQIVNDLKHKPIRI